MGKIYNGGNNYGESLDDIDYLEIGDIYDDNHMILDATDGYTHISLYNTGYYTDYFTEVDAGSIYLSSHNTDADEHGITSIHAGDIETDDILRSSYWGYFENPSSKSRSLDEALSYIRQNMSGLGNGYIQLVEQDIINNSGWGSGDLTDPWSLRQVLENLEESIEDGFDNGYMHISENDIVQDRHVGVNGYWGTEEPLRVDSLRAALSNLATSGSSVPNPSGYTDGYILTVNNDEWAIDRNIAYGFNNGDLYSDGTDICLDWGYWGSEPALQERSLSMVLNNLATEMTTLTAIDFDNDYIYSTIRSGGDIEVNGYWGGAAGDNLHNESLKQVLVNLDNAINGSAIASSFNNGTITIDSSSGYHASDIINSSSWQATGYTSLQDTLSMLSRLISDLDDRVTALES